MVWEGEGLWMEVSSMLRPELGGGSLPTSRRGAAQAQGDDNKGLGPGGNRCGARRPAKLLSERRRGAKALGVGFHPLRVGRPLPGHSGKDGVGELTGSCGRPGGTTDREGDPGDFGRLLYVHDSSRKPAERSRLAYP